ncbi:MAG: type 4a pilus biogenesis protein PilO [Gammaproteobacteria bacterium]|nr:type 4a pilus biogenesis protein PilO [Gammaproteobacteria bacterium]MDH3768569.1 type 4a pilus biogenesis protein PilO [Gammaproteobacteria bacterium]
MNFFDQLRALDFNDIGRWPLLFRALLIGLLFILVVFVGVYYKVFKEKLPQLERVQQEEQSLRSVFENKQGQAVNLDAYNTQLSQMEGSFGALLRQLPNRTEVPSLLVDISQTGLAAGLDEELFQPSGEVRKEDFYAELPIRIRLRGSFHELAAFVSGVAALPRIVTLHDIDIKGAQDSPNDMVLDLTAKTYRYLDEESELGGQP